MAEQATGVTVGDRDLRRNEQVPPPSRGADNGPRADVACRVNAANRAGTADRTGTTDRAAATDRADTTARPVRRSHCRRSPSGGRGRCATVLLIGLPLLGAGADEAFGPGVGLFFAVCAVLGCGGSAALVGRGGWWWVVPAGPPVVLAVTAVAELLANPGKYRNVRSLATGAAHWTITGFPVMIVALAAALTVVLVRIGRGRRHRHG
ncbi:DUF6542 domain-containing protein [Kitasatospora sp. MAP5-34]|uniref:DUF6542 domain-containing protein n=1 Tax=Kitasatospora sp. MAP5-34 TaxID=3035102 RepID=UPI0024731B3B|nr:DUF6542 domain-containing protein [Kitasatospora sp. MAP5-34]MDH6576756.1 hypothetical protein [Kitasatospora sp. MAP5-34]